MILSLAIARIPLRWGIIIPLSIVMSLVIYIIRSSPFSFGLHTLVLILLLVIFIAKTTSVSPSMSFLAVFISTSALAGLEYFFLNLFLAITNLDLQAVMADPVLWAVMGTPQVVVMILLGVLVAHYLKSTKLWNPLLIGCGLDQKISFYRRL